MASYCGLFTSSSNDSHCDRLRTVAKRASLPLPSLPPSCVCVCTHLHMHGTVHATVCEWGSEDDFQKSVLSSLCVGPGDGTQVVRHGEQCPTDKDLDRR